MERLRLSINAQIQTHGAYTKIELAVMATRADVAKLAGVSQSTVSYTLSGARPISEATRQKVLAAVRELDYHPNVLAGALARGSSHTLALLFPSGESGISPASLEYITGAANAARELGYHLVLWPSDNQEFKEIKSLCNSGWISGVLLMEIQLSDDRVEYLVRSGVPTALIGRTADGEDLDFVDQDFDAVAKITLDHLHELEHQSIALMDTKSKIEEGVGFSIRSNQALKNYAKELGMDVMEIWVEGRVSAGRDALKIIRRDHPEVTAIIGLNDLATMGLLNAANEFDIKVPDELSIISLSTPNEYAETTWPALTTVTMPAHNMGRAAAEVLIQRLRDGQTHAHQELWTGELTVRATTAKVRKANKYSDLAESPYRVPTPLNQAARAN